MLFIPTVNTIKGQGFTYIELKQCSPSSQFEVNKIVHTKQETFGDSG